MASSSTCIAADPNSGHGQYYALTRAGMRQGKEGLLDLLLDLHFGFRIFFLVGLRVFPYVPESKAKSMSLMLIH